MFYKYKYEYWLLVFIENFYKLFLIKRIYNNYNDNNILYSSINEI